MLVYEPYTPSFYYKRKSIILKYKFTCQNCEFNNPNIKQKKDTQYLTVHHIDYNKKNDTNDNLIVLCNICNSKANANRGVWESKFRKQKDLECQKYISLIKY